MKKKLFISNLDFEINTDQLREMFAEFGPCSNVVIVFDRETKRSKGYAFVEMDNEDDATNAIKALNNKLINGRPMKVVEDRGKTTTAGSGEAEEDYKKQKREILPPIQRTQLFKRRKKLDPFMADPSKTIDYKDVSVLTRYVSERGKMYSRRMTGLSAYNQRKVAKAIKRAQNLGLMSFSNVG